MISSNVSNMGLDDKNNRVGSVLDKKLHGVPTEFGVSDAGQMLKIQSKQLTTLQELARRQQVQAPSHEHASPQNTPQIHIDVPNVAKDLNPQFNALVSGQQELADAVKEAGYYGQLALSEARLQTHALRHLDIQGHTAHQQRNVALEILARSLIEHDKASQLLQINGQFLFEGNEIASAGNAKLDGIQGTLEHGNTLMATGNRKLDSVKDALLEGFGEIGSGISHLSLQQAGSTAALLHQMNQSEDVFLWAHKERYAQMNEALYALRNPISVRSNELWRLGETARMAGRPAVAQHLFHQSLQENPVNARAYYSLAMMAFDQQSPDLAGPLLDEAIVYATSEPRFHAALLLMKGKFERMCGNIQYALYALAASHSENQMSLETWYELALAFSIAGDDAKAIYFLRNLVAVAQRKSHGYLAKILGNPVFFKYIEYLPL